MTAGLQIVWAACSGAFTHRVRDAVLCTTLVLFLFAACLTTFLPQQVRATSARRFNLGCEDEHILLDPALHLLDARFETSIRLAIVLRCRIASGQCFPVKSQSSRCM